MTELATALEVLVMLGAPILLARWVVRRWPVRWATVGAGAATFVGSQVVHLPLDALVLPRIHAAGLAVVATYVGLAAGVCEELARFVALRFWRRDDRTGAHALAFGAGHGGIESVILGVVVALTLVNLLVLDRVGVAQLVPDASQRDAVTASLAAAHAHGTVPALLGAVERLCTIPFHLAASALVMRAVVEKRVRWLLFAIALHALDDGAVVAAGALRGPMLAEAVVVLGLPVSLVVLFTTLRALPRLPRPPREERPAASGAPLELVRAEKSFGDVHALKGIGFTLAKGERACLLGPNGAGKTTAIRLVTGALAPTRGFAFVFGKTSDDDAFLDEKRRVGVVPQQPGMYAEMTVRQYLAFVRDVYGTTAPDDDVAARLGLSDFMERRTSELSGGLQRRLALAAALLPRPELLVLDEPSAGLDPVAARQMIDCVRDASTGRTTLLCTHNLAEAEELCDNVIILREGQVVVHAPIAELRATIAARVALRAGGDADALVAALRERGHAPELDDGAVVVRLPSPEASTPKLLRELLDAGLPVYECRIVRPTLEDVFFKLVEGGAS